MDKLKYILGKRPDWLFRQQIIPHLTSLSISADNNTTESHSTAKHYGYSALLHMVILKKELYMELMASGNFSYFCPEELVVSIR